MKNFSEYTVVDLLPHAPPAILIDSVLDHSDNAASTLVLIKEGIPFFEQNMGVPAHVGLEYMAQTCGVFAGLVAKEKNQPVRLGFLLGTRNFKSNIEWFEPNTTLKITAQEVFNSDNMGSFSCYIYCNEVEIALATLTVYQPEDPSGVLDPTSSKNI